MKSRKRPSSYPTLTAALRAAAEGEESVQGGREIDERRSAVSTETQAAVATTPERIAAAVQLLNSLALYVSQNKAVLAETLGRDYRADPEEGKQRFAERLGDIETLLLETELQLKKNPHDYERKSFEKISEVINLLMLSQVPFDAYETSLTGKDIHPQASILFDMFNTVVQQLDAIQQAETRSPEKQKASDRIADFIIVLQAASHTLTQAKAALSRGDERAARDLIRDATARADEACHMFSDAVSRFVHPEVVHRLDEQIRKLQSFVGVNILSERLVNETIDRFCNTHENAVMDLRDVVAVYKFLPAPKGTARQKVINFLTESAHEETSVGPGLQAAVKNVAGF